MTSLRFSFALAPALAALALAPSALAADPPAKDDGPVVELAPEHAAQTAKPDAPVVSLGAGTAPESELVHGMTEQRFRAAAASLTSTAIGGYGEVQITGLTRGREGEREWTADVSRLVLFVAHSFTEKARVYTELEVEHAAGCATCRGAVEIEQAYVDYKLLGDALGVRAGLVLVPMGIINQWHEPPIFNGVVRPKVETEIIPSTWREIGAGFFGNIEPFRYELYAMTGLDPMALSDRGLAPARQGGSFAKANSWAVVGRAEVEPILGFVVGASGYASDAGENGELYSAADQRVEQDAPIVGWEADARMKLHGFEWRVLYAEFRLPEAEELMDRVDREGDRLYDPAHPIPTAIRGAYVEAGYDVLHPFGSRQHLVPFARIEGYSTQAEVPDEYRADPRRTVREYTFGLTYRPIQQLVVKADYQLRDRELGFDETQLNFGLGFMY